MIKRNSKNIGKVVTIQYPCPNKFNGRLGTVVGFRGDMEKGNPYANVFIHTLKSVWPVPGSYLKWTGERKEC